MNGRHERFPNDIAEGLRPLSHPVAIERARFAEGALRDDLEHDATIVDLGYCIGSECSREHGVRVATRRGTGPASIYILCDECYEERLEAEAKPFMAEVRGVDWIRHLGLHALHRGAHPSATGATPASTEARKNEPASP